MTRWSNQEGRAESVGYDARDHQIETGESFQEVDQLAQKFEQRLGHQKRFSRKGSHNLTTTHLSYQNSSFQ